MNTSTAGRRGKPKSGGKPESPSQAQAYVAMLDYLLSELSGTSPMTAYLLQLARQNLLDEQLARASGGDGAKKRQARSH